MATGDRVAGGGYAPVDAGGGYAAGVVGAAQAVKKLNANSKAMNDFILMIFSDSFPEYNDITGRVVPY